MWTMQPWRVALEAFEDEDMANPSTGWAVRSWRADDDPWRARAFLRAAFLTAGRRAHVWHLARFDYLRAHVLPNVTGGRLEDLMLAHEVDGELRALAIADGAPGEVHLAVHAHLRSADLEDALLAAAEARLARVDDDGRRMLAVWAAADDDLRRERLRARGYAPQGSVERIARRDLGAEVTPVPLAPGYAVRSLGDGLDLLERCHASGLAFHDGDLRVAADNRDDPSWYRGLQRAPLYRRDLDLVAVAPDGAIAAFATVWFDDVTRSVLFEPVATVPAHRRRGLGLALLTEGLRRARGLGADLALVGGYGDAANALYRAAFGDEHEDVEAWVRRW